MKKILRIVVLSLLWCNVSFSDVGTGTMNISDNVIRYFQEYLQTRKPSPVKFLITEDGQDSRSWMCPYSECAPTGSSQEERKCRSQTGKTCYTLALRRSIKWKNEFTKKAKTSEKRFSSKDDFSTIKEKLRKLGLVGYGPEINEKKKVTKKVKKSTNTDKGDIVSQIKDLKELLDAGAINQEEFDKAKKKLLN
tara:strand:- start:8 stop:586 length:579 start_codon:yes stop_codon:yes gene_type:complete